MRGAIAAALVILAGSTAAQPSSFSFDPQPRWAAEPETEVVCQAIRAECSGQLKDGAIDTVWKYAELFDADGRLVGIRSLQSTGCKPLDEHMLLGQRRSAVAFTKPGEPDLDSITVELAAGLPRDSVRLVKRGDTSVSIDC